MRARIPENEDQRLAALQEYAVLDTGAEQAYDDITMLAAYICDVPMAMMTLVDEDRQWFKSKVGLPFTQTPRDASFCAHAILEPAQVTLDGDGLQVLVGQHQREPARRLGLARQEQFEGAGIYYAATEVEARRCRSEDVIVVGGGNSAGQAAMFLSESARRVYLVYRGADLAHSMSQYLISRLQHAPNVTILTSSNVVALNGESGLESVTLDGPGGRQDVTTRAVFALIGATPCTEWLQDIVGLDSRGFVMTGSSPAHPTATPFETSVPGIFAVGDVRANSVKRVASAVGEGSVAIAGVHQYLAATPIPTFVPQETP